MAYRLFGAKPLLQPMLIYCQLNHGNKFQWILNQNHGHCSVRDQNTQNVFQEIGIIFSKSQWVKNRKLLICLGIMSVRAPSNTNTNTLLLGVQRKCTKTTVSERRLHIFRGYKRQYIFCAYMCWSITTETYSQKIYVMPKLSLWIIWKASRGIF